MASLEKKSINCIKLVLTEQGRTNKWLALQLHKDCKYQLKNAPHTN